MQRNTYLDVVKGVGILLVVFGHLTKGGQIWREWIYAFHMPLFFMLSGVFVRTDMPFGDFLRKKLRTLYLPYAVFLTVDKLVGTCTLMRKGSGFADAFLTSKPSLWSYLGTHFRTMNAPIWFLFALFLLQIALYFLSKKRALLIAAAILTVPATVPLWYFEIPYGELYLNAVPAFGFLAVGYLFRDRFLSFDPASVLQKKSVPVWIAAAGVAPAYLLCSAVNGGVDMLCHLYGNHLILYYCCAAAGIVLVLLGCCALHAVTPLRRVLAWFGQNTLCILVTHYYLTREAFPALLDHFGMLYLIRTPWMECLLFAVTAPCLVPIVLVCRRWLYAPLGLTKPKRG